jgi:gliding motility-associated-like protein
MLKIFNRWGNLVYENFDYHDDWGGRCNTGLLAGSQHLPEGTYYYIIEFEGNANQQVGFLTLKR